MLKNFIENENGQGLVEYALILALISIVAIAALTAIGNATNKTLQNVADHLNSAT